MIWSDHFNKNLTLMYSSQNQYNLILIHSPQLIILSLPLVPSLLPKFLNLWLKRVVASTDASYCITPSVFAELQSLQLFPSTVHVVEYSNSIESFPHHL